MDIFLISDSQAVLLDAPLPAMPPGAFTWLDCTHDEVAANPEAWRDAVERIAGVHLYDPHLSDVVNLKHPSYFESTQDYAMLVFRKLASEAAHEAVGRPLNGTSSSALHVRATAHEGLPDNKEKEPAGRKLPAALGKLLTQPVTFLIAEDVLITVHATGSRTIDAARRRLLEYRPKPHASAHAPRPPASPQELMLRLLNAMVDQYLDLRHPLTMQIDRWQRALLNPRRPFNDWIALLDARIELRKLDHLCEEQHDALQELRDYLIDTIDSGEHHRTHDLLLVRVNDVMEHVTRVLNHARRLEASVESAVQIHFSAMAHRTSDIMRTLTVITALFMPLTLITGVFGMNFADMPLLKSKNGFWIAMALMGIVVSVLLFLFRRKRYLEDHHRQNQV